MGQHRFEYALTTFSGDWQTAGIVSQAHAFAYPPLAVLSDAHAGTLAPNAALVRCDNPHIILSALSAAHRVHGFLGRWYNASDAAQTAEIHIPLAVRVRAVNLLEQPARATIRRAGVQRWRVRFCPFEMVTLQVRTD